MTGCKVSWVGSGMVARVSTNSRGTGNEKRSPIELRYQHLCQAGSLFALAPIWPLASRRRNAHRLSRLRRSRIKQIVNLFQNPPTQLQQFFPDTAFMLRHGIDLSRVR